MKRILIALTLLISSCTPAFAALDVSDITDKIELKQGIVYSLKDSEFHHASTAEIVEKWGVSLELGYIDSGKLLTAVSKELVNAKDHVNIPIVQELMFRPGLYVAFDEIDTGDAKVDYGISATFLELKF